MIKINNKVNVKKDKTPEFKVVCLRFTSWEPAYFQSTSNKNVTLTTTYTSLSTRTSRDTQFPSQ